MLQFHPPALQAGLLEPETISAFTDFLEAGAVDVCGMRPEVLHFRFAVTSSWHISARKSSDFQVLGRGCNQKLDIFPQSRMLDDIEVPWARDDHFEGLILDLDVPYGKTQPAGQAGTFEMHLFWTPEVSLVTQANPQRFFADKSTSNLGPDADQGMRREIASIVIPDASSHHARLAAITKAVSAFSVLQDVWMFAGEGAKSMPYLAGLDLNEICSAERNIR